MSDLALILVLGVLGTVAIVIVLMLLGFFDDDRIDL
jgi:hypothetical protein